MPAFVIAEISAVQDQGTYARYRDRVHATISAHGGQYLVRGGRVELLEGTWSPGRLVVVSFESLDAALAWWNSPEYAELKAMRQRSATTNMIIAEGVECRTIARF